VCETHRLSFPDIVREIEASVVEVQAEEQDWAAQPLYVVVGHIITRYHGRLRETLPHLERVAARVLRVHGGKAPRLLGRIEAIVLEMSAELNDHMRKEELVLFPAIVAEEAGSPLARRVSISAPIAVMEQEHDRIGDLLTELRAITNAYVVPEWGCETVRALYDGLEEIERDMHVHVHLENNVLFPRALRLAELATAS
jgi:regulator of cell morphogenesis and NO signaling